MFRDCIGLAVLKHSYALVPAPSDQIVRIFSNSCWQFTDAGSLRRGKTDTAKIVHNTYTHEADDVCCMFAHPREISAYYSYCCAERLRSGSSTTLYEVASRKLHGEGAKTSPNCYEACDGNTFKQRRAGSHNTERRKGWTRALSSLLDEKVFTERV